MNSTCVMAQLAKYKHMWIPLERLLWKHGDYHQSSTCIQLKRWKENNIVMAVMIFIKDKKIGDCDIFPSCTFFVNFTYL